MGAVEMLGVAGSLSLLAGWRLYAVVLATGLALRLDLVELPARLGGLDVLANPWVIGVAAFGAAAEFFADKVALLDSAWDTLHTAIRPLGGALLATAAVSPDDPAWQVVVLLAGGGATLLSHGAKAGTRALVNTSPEPFSNIAVSTAEDVGVAGGLWLLWSQPELAVAIAAVLTVVAGLALWAAWRAFGSLRAAWRRRAGGARG